MTRSWLYQLRHRMILMGGSLAMLMVASGQHLKAPVTQLDTTGNHHAVHDTKPQRNKDRIQRRFLIPKKDPQTPKSELTSSSS